MTYISHQESQIIDAYHDFYKRNGINCKKEWTMGGERKIEIEDQTLSEIHLKLESEMLIDRSKLKTHKFNFRYKIQDLKASIDYLEKFTYTELINSIKDDALSYDIGSVSKFAKRNGRSIMSRFGKVLDALKDIRQLTETPSSQRKELYTSQAVTAERRVSKIFDKALPTQRIGHSKSFKEAIKTLSVFHNRWK